MNIYVYIHKSHKYHPRVYVYNKYLLCINKYLFISSKIANPAELLQLLINFDMLQEAAALALEYLNAVMGHGKEYFGVEVKC